MSNEQPSQTKEQSEKQISNTIKHHRSETAHQENELPDQ